jgi:hypothetical protein
MRWQFATIGMSRALGNEKNQPKLSQNQQITSIQLSHPAFPPPTMRKDGRS